MPVSHVFTRRGFGVVIMGIPVDGTIQVGNEVEVVPGNQRGRISGIQQFLNDTPDGEYGQCLALNIPSFDKKPPVRGQVLSLPGYLEPASFFHVKLKAVSGLQSPIRNAEPVKLHTGTSEQLGKIFLLESNVLREGETGLATVALSNPVVVAALDRFIIRRLSPLTTIAGGEILIVSRLEKKPKKKHVAEQLNDYLAFFRGVDPLSAEGLEKKVEYFFSRRLKSGASLQEISRETLLKENVVEECLVRLKEKGKLLSLGTGQYIHSDTYGSFLKEVESRLRKVAAEQEEMSLTFSKLRQGFDWPVRLWKRIEEDLEAKGVVERRANRLILPAAVEKMSEDNRRLMAEIQKIYSGSGFRSPRPEELPGILRESKERIGRMMDFLYSQKKLIRLSRNVVLGYDNFIKARDMVVNTIKKKGSLDSADFKRYIGSSRKYALGILDFLDSQGITVRSGNIRRLTSDYQKKLL